MDPRASSLLLSIGTECDIHAGAGPPECMLGVFRAMDVTLGVAAVSVQLQRLNGQQWD